MPEDDVVSPPQQQLRRSSYLNHLSYNDGVSFLYGAYSISDESVEHGTHQKIEVLLVHLRELLYKEKREKGEIIQRELLFEDSIDNICYKISIKECVNNYLIESVEIDAPPIKRKRAIQV